MTPFDSLSEDVLELVGPEAGPTSFIMAGVHGNELCGVEACRRVFASFELKRGRLLLAVGNPRATAAQQRITEANINRLFVDPELLTENQRQSYEFRRACFLKDQLRRADVLLDLHASPVPDSTPFAIGEKNGLTLIERLPIGRVVSGFDAIEPGGTDYYMNKIGKVGICVECGCLSDPIAIDKSVEVLETFLRLQGHCDGPLPAPYAQEKLRLFTLYHTQTNAFRLARPFDDFDALETGTLIGTDGETEVRAPEPARILFASAANSPGEEAFLLARREA